MFAANMPTNSEEYMQVRTEMQAKQQEIQQKLAATNRALLPWKLVMGGLLVLITGSCIAAEMVASGWAILTTLSILGSTICITLFYSSSGKKKLAQFWSLRNELTVLEAHQRLIEEICEEILSKDISLRIRHYKTFKENEQALTELTERVQNLTEQQQQRQKALGQQSGRKEASGSASV